MKRDISIYVKDILENMDRAEEFVKDVNYGDFVKDEKTHYAVVRCIEIIGEAAKHIPDCMRNRYSRIPWKDMAGMRDKVVHFYFGVNLERVWLVVKDDIPKIKPLIEKVFEDLQGE
ncbi:MAG: DUF86 domain-containing protein [Candidatus Latescibacteria bacterium]|nr:DUF86 domain-containing protein [Candidatus Latescibacterota bacterium]